MLDYINLRAGQEMPSMTVQWERPIDAVSDPLSVWLSQVDTELEMDIGGVREPMEMDGVQGWLTHLGPADLVRPDDGQARFRLMQEWRYDRRIYLSVSNARVYQPSSLWGDAIALQWNRDGIHYLLIAQNALPITLDELLKMANSMAPAEFSSLDRGNLSGGG